MSQHVSVPNGTDIHDVAAAIAFLWNDDLPPRVSEQLADLDGDAGSRIAQAIIARREYLRS